jgi:BMFP domain-containing protein YqiC
MEAVWETFNLVFEAVHHQGRRIEELEARIAELEKKLEGKVLPFEKKEAA